MNDRPQDVPATEFSVLQRYGVRWAVLAAWHAELRSRGVTLEADLTAKLDDARTKIATGCYSICTVGGRLGEIEGTLVSLAASTDPGSVDGWLEILGQSMSTPEKVKEVISIPAVQAQYLRCGPLPCE